MEKKDTNVKKSKKVKRAKRKCTFAKILLVVLILALIGIMSLLFLLYGPWSGFRDWLITTAMSSMRHQYLATWFYDDKTIQECLNKNKVVEVSGVTDENTIEIVDYDKKEEVVYANEYERQILEKDENNNELFNRGIRIWNIKETLEYKFLDFTLENSEAWR